MRERIAKITCWAFSVLFLVLAGKEHLARGGPQRPRTIMSHSGLWPQKSEAALLLLRHAARTIPPLARVAVIKPGNRGQDDVMLMAGHGQLPRHHAVQFDESPDFVITIDAPLEDARFVKIYEADGGAIWERVRLP